MLNDFEKAIVENDIKSMLTFILDDPGIVKRHSSSGCPPLVLASSRGMPEGIRILIRYGAPVNELSGPFIKSSVLIMAVHLRRIDNVKALLRHAADPTTDEANITPLQWSRTLAFQEIESVLNEAVNCKKHLGFLLKKWRLSGLQQRPRTSLSSFPLDIRTAFDHF